MNGQADLTNVVILQPRFLASSWTAGKIAIMWLSPSTATEIFDLLDPKWQTLIMELFPDEAHGVPVAILEVSKEASDGSGISPL
jgi:hypothetical protein